MLEERFSFKILVIHHVRRSTPCPHVKQSDEWIDPNVCEAGDGCKYCHTRTEQQFHPEVWTNYHRDIYFDSCYCRFINQRNVMMCQSLVIVHVDHFVRLLILNVCIPDAICSFSKNILLHTFRSNFPLEKHDSCSKIIRCYFYIDVKEWFLIYSVELLNFYTLRNNRESRLSIILSSVLHFFRGIKIIQRLRSSLYKRITSIIVYTNTGR